MLRDAVMNWSTSVVHGNQRLEILGDHSFEYLIPRKVVAEKRRGKWKITI